MTLPPKSVIHINFLPGELPFDARPIWTALARNVERGQVPAPVVSKLQETFRETAIHLATRYGIMKRAIGELNSALQDLYSQIPDPCEVPIVSGQACEDARDRVLLAIDAFLFEFRACLDLLARFVYGVLSGVGKGPAQSEQLSSGGPVQITEKGGKLKPHNFLLYICDKLPIATDWYDFLSTHRNFFAHEGAPYCAIEELGERPPRFDLLIMKSNIHDFQHADPSEFFRVSECQPMVNGIRALSAAIQQHLLELLGN
jgi:hypothetical protein